MTDQPHYPYRDGDFAVLGPEVVASADGMTITWQGARYRRDHGLDPERRDQLDAALAALGKSEIELGEARATVARVRAIAAEHPVSVDAALIHAALDQPAAHNAGPSIAECAAQDARWWNGEKAGE